MEVFLPIAQVHVTAIEIILLSALVGVLSGPVSYTHLTLPTNREV